MRMQFTKPIHSRVIRLPAFKIRADIYPLIDARILRRIKTKIVIIALSVCYLRLFQAVIISDYAGVDGDSLMFTHLRVIFPHLPVLINRKYSINPHIPAHDPVKIHPVLVKAYYL